MREISGPQNLNYRLAPVVRQFFTPRETQILIFAAEHQTIKHAAIAKGLGVSRKTVKNLISGLRNNIELIEAGPDTSLPNDGILGTMIRHGEHHSCLGNLIIAFITQGLMVEFDPLTNKPVAPKGLPVYTLPQE